MTWLLAIALVAAVVGLALAAVFARQLRASWQEAEAFRSAALDWERNCKAARESARQARGDAATARKELEAERRERMVDKGHYETSLQALRDALAAAKAEAVRFR